MPTYLRDTSFIFENERGVLFMANANFIISRPSNEKVRIYESGSLDRQLLEAELERLSNEVIDIPLIINGEEIRTSERIPCTMPHDHQKVIGYYYAAGEAEIQTAIETAIKAKESWEQLPWEHRASIFLKAAELLATKWRYTMNAATMLSQSKNIHQAEIDVVCELIDFFKFNAYYMDQIFNEQVISTNDSWNRVEYMGLEGFVYAVSPFNFTSIGGNLATAPAIAGNVVLWKPASTAVYSNYFVMKLLEEAGLPKGVINFIPGKASLITDVILKDNRFAGFNYTGSTNVFSGIWKKISNNLEIYKSYPRIVGETGGKNFIFAHESADVDSLGTSLLRGAFEYQGQKCSAASRAYIPVSIWSRLKRKLIKDISTIAMGDVKDFTNFMNAVIDEKSFKKITSYIENAKVSDDAYILCGGGHDDSKGYFIEPTVIIAKNYDYITMREEIFGPVLTIHVYENEDFDKMLDICDKTSPYALTGAIFSKERNSIVYMQNKLKHTAGNFYINDKPTGAVVGQQPFGGARASGTNDKAGSKFNLLRWINAKVVKENFTPPTEYGYKFMEK